MKEILKMAYIAVCLAVCLYPIYRWVEDAVYEIGSYFKHIHHSDSCRNKIIRIVIFIRDLWEAMSVGGFCNTVEEKANEMIVMIRECSNIRNLF